MLHNCPLPFNNKKVEIFEKEEKKKNIMVSFVNNCFGLWDWPIFSGFYTQHGYSDLGLDPLGYLVLKAWIYFFFFLFRVPEDVPENLLDPIWILLVFWISIKNRPI